jgi:hypothetical protein
MTSTETFLPTPEQQAIIDAFATGKDMVIEAGAGTGKTSTLRMVAESTDHKGIYIVYNKAAQLDAKAIFPDNVDCRTAHSLAYGGMMRLPNGKAIIERAYRDKKYVKSSALVSFLGIPAGYQSGEQFIPAWIVAGSAIATLRRFCNSADESITSRHVPKVDGLEDQQSYKEFVVPFAEKAWTDANKATGQVKVTPDYTVKMWALTNPKLNTEFIMLDEAQDTNPVLAKVVEDQTVQKVMVGDRCQQLYEWRGAVDAMTNFEVEHRLCLSQSFRFGSAIAGNANMFLDLLDAPLRLSGFDKITSSISVVPMTDPDAILCRTNASVIEHAMHAQQSGKKVAIVGGTAEIEKFAKGARDLQSGRTASNPEFVAFRSWGEVQAYSKTDEGSDIRVMVKLVDDYGVEDILAVCAGSVSEKDADIIVSTAHKSKGREWNHVKIASDFSPPEEGVMPSHGELCLAYVAVTRAKLVLDPGTLAWVNDYAQEVVA